MYRSANSGWYGGWGDEAASISTDKLAMLKIEKAAELSQLIAAVGLLQNLAALMALVDEGIAQGMYLYRNLMLQLGVETADRSLVKLALTDYLQQHGRLT